MKGKRTMVGSILAMLLLALAAGLTLAQEPQPPGESVQLQGDMGIQAALGTAFTYQGQLRRDGNLVNGACDFRFTLWDAETGGNQIGPNQEKTNVPVTNGLFTVQLDFGAGAFQGDARWLQIAVKCAGDASYTTLSPRQPLTPAPYALALPGLWTQQNATSPNIIGGYSGNSVTSGVVGATIGGGGHAGFPNQVTSDFGVVGGGDHNTASGTVATVGGGEGNTASGDHATVAGGLSNTASGAWATIGGGQNNIVSGTVATVSGGLSNIASWDSATVGGGSSNTASNFAATVGGGYGNTASGGNAAVGGGLSNTASGWYATVGGGFYNTASGYAATVPGGRDNTAQGAYSFAAGRRAKANHDGAFVWADSTNADFTSTAANQFAVRATGGVSFSIGTSNFLVNGNTVWHAGNDGPGSGLDADTLDGLHASAFAPYNHPGGVPIIFDDFDRSTLNLGWSPQWITSTSGLGSVYMGPDRGLVIVDSGYGGAGAATLYGKKQRSVLDGTLIFKANLLAYEDNNIAYGDGLPRGLVNGTNRNNAIEFINYTGSAVKARTVKNGVATETVYYIPGTYPENSVYAVRFYMIVATATEVKFYLDGVLIATHTTNIPTVPLNPYFGVWYPGYGGVPLGIDYVSFEIIR